MLRHLDLKREDRINKAADAASMFVEVDYIFDEDESIPELSEWIGLCEYLNIRVTGKSEESCKTLMEMAVKGELLMNQDKAYEILRENKQFQFFL